MSRPSADGSSRLASCVRGLRGVAVVIAVLGVVLALLLPSLAGSDALPAATRLPWWVLALLFAAFEVCVLHVQVRSEAQTISLHEIPLVLGLFLADPLTVVVARVVGAAPVLLLHRRQAPIKAGFNLVLFAADAAVALTVFRLFPVHAVTSEAVAWTATFCAVTAGGVLAATATTLVIAAYEQRLQPADLWREPFVDVPRVMAVATLALIAVYALSLDGGASVPLLAAAGVVLVAYRAYAALSERHLSLERLYRFSQAVSSDPEMDGVLRSVLTEAKELLHAERAQVVFASPGQGGAAVVALNAADRLVRSESEALLTPEQVDSRVVATGTGELVPRGSRLPAHRRLLTELQARDAVVAPLRGAAGVLGTITVLDRLGDIRTFDPADLRLLVTVANHASMALQNGRLIDQLRHDALHDALTGLPNRVFLQRSLSEAVADLASVPGVAVMIMDLDGFKEVNDTLGHLQGDALLREVATRLTTAGGADAVVARLGGDEFAVLLPCAPDPDGAVRRARRLLQALEHPIDLDGLDVEVGGSIGVAWAPEHGTEPSVLLKRADVAMYAAKGTSAGVRLYEASMDTSSPQRLALVGEIRTAVELTQFEVHVQPKARLDTGEVSGVEALVRWQHPVHGAVPPDEFVPVAERSGLIGPLTTLVLKQSLQACAAWRARGRELGIAVNLSARSLSDLDLADDVGLLLRRYAVPARLLTLEITESSVMADPARAMSVLLRLRDMGVRLSVDDFGTGYSSLSYLKRLPVHEVKIDKSFITNMVNDSDDATIVRSIVDLARNLSLEVVAEGVEDPQAWCRLTELGCTYAQGWHLGRAMPVAELLPWLETRPSAGLRRLYPLPVATGG